MAIHQVTVRIKTEYDSTVRFVNSISPDSIITPYLTLIGYLEEMAENTPPTKPTDELISIVVDKSRKGETTATLKTREEGREYKLISYVYRSKVIYVEET